MSGKTKGKTKTKKECPITRHQFRNSSLTTTEVAAIVLPKIDLNKKEFGTGSMGWNATGKAKVMIDGVEVPVQIGLNVTIIGSKDAVEGGPAAEVPAPEQNEAA